MKSKNVQEWYLQIIYLGIYIPFPSQKQTKEPVYIYA
jgi:hypothetical protein